MIDATSLNPSTPGEPGDSETETPTLLSRASRGDELAFGELLDRHLTRLHTYVRLRMGPELRARESVSDLVQSACREVLQHAERFQYQGEGHFRRWLFTTALRKVKNRVRYLRTERRDVRREVEPTFEDASEPLNELCEALGTPSHAAVAKEELQHLEEAFERLPKHYQEVICLARIMGLSHQEVGQRMGCQEAAARQLLLRALNRLSKEARQGGDSD